MHYFRKSVCSLLIILFISGCSSVQHMQEEPIHESEQQLKEQQNVLPTPTMEMDHQPKVTVKQSKGQTKMRFVDQKDNTDPLRRKRRISPIKVRGIYVSGWNMNGLRFKRLVKLIEKTDLNAMVIDVKNDFGQVTYPSHVPLVREIAENRKIIVPDMKKKLVELKKKGIYSIARIVVFKDPYLAASRKGFELKSKAGVPWRDEKGVKWVDPFKEKVWSYNIALAKEAAALGFDEIQFDYVRFPDNARRVDAEVQYENPKGLSKSDTITAFLKQAKRELPNHPISADVFGLTTSSSHDMGIGQMWSKITAEVDAISPMIYPSHYNKGVYGVSNPDLEPRRIISKALQDAIHKTRNSSKFQKGHQLIIRPWYQDFTATWVKPHRKYGNKEIKEQIRAGHDLGIDEFLLWNAAGRYSYK